MRDVGPKLPERKNFVRATISLTAREREVMGHVTAGLMNKQVAGLIGLSEITVKIHRGNMMRKMGVKSLAELVRAAEALGISQTRGPDQT